MDLHNCSRGAGGEGEGEEEEGGEEDGGGENLAEWHRK